MNNAIEIRRLLHDNPGVSGCEAFAHDMIVSVLRGLAPDGLHEHIGGYGVVAFWRPTEGVAATGSAVPTVAFRADTDALPSGHRCGHDGHTATLLRFAQIVAGAKRRYGVLLIFQPEEETGKGAGKIVASGLLQKYGVKAIFGLHNLPGYAEGVVVLNRNTFAAASCGVIYRLIGRETHASTPEKGLNPGMAVADIIKAFDALCRYDASGFRLSTLICCRVGEASFGTSAGSAELMFTLRATTNAGMQGLMDEADGIVAEAAQRAGLDYDKELREPFRATENTPYMVDSLYGIFAACGEDRIKPVFADTPFRWSEDFADYLVGFPGVFFGIGSGENHLELHHPDYVFPDGIIDIGAKCFELTMNNIEL